MAKHIAEEKLVQNFKEIADFKLPPGTVQRDLADIRKLLSDQETISSSVGKNVWRIIMQNKVTRYASAAIIFFAVFIALQFIQETELNAAQLLTKVSKNMQQFLYVKMVTKSYLPDQQEPDRIDTLLFDYKNKQVFTTYDGGYLHQHDYQNWIWRLYRPEDNTMIVQQLTGEWRDADVQVGEFIEKLKQEGLEVTKKELLDNESQLTVIEYDNILNNISIDPDQYQSNMIIGRTPVKTIHTRLIIDRDQLYLSRYEIRYYDPQDKLIVTRITESEPVEGVPTDIYDYGAPADAKIINKVPDERVKDIRSKIREKQAYFLENYIAVQTETDYSDGQERLMEAMVIYSQGKNLRVDVLRPKFYSDNKIQHPLEVSELLKDSIARLEPYVSEDLRPRSVRIYDGLWQHILDEHNKKLILRTPQRRPDGDQYGDDDIDDFGWRLLWLHGNHENMYENEFSSENNLLGMEVTWQSQWGWLPERKVLYVDPAKDYLYRRYTEEKIADAPWQIDEDWIEEVKDKYQLVERVSHYEVTEYAQTSQGQWYPKTINQKGYIRFPFRENRDKKYENNRIIRIHLLEENPDLPDELFDPEQLSILGIEKR